MRRTSYCLWFDRDSRPNTSRCFTLNCHGLLSQTVNFAPYRRLLLSFKFAHSALCQFSLERRKAFLPALGHSDGRSLPATLQVRSRSYYPLRIFGSTLYGDPGRLSDVFDNRLFRAAIGESKGPIKPDSFLPMCR